MPRNTPRHREIIAIVDTSLPSELGLRYINPDLHISTEGNINRSDEMFQNISRT